MCFYLFRRCFRILFSVVSSLPSIFSFLKRHFLLLLLLLIIPKELVFAETRNAKISRKAFSWKTSKPDIHSIWTKSCLSHSRLSHRPVPYANTYTHTREPTYTFTLFGSSHLSPTYLVLSLSLSIFSKLSFLSSFIFLFGKPKMSP